MENLEITEKKNVAIRILQLMNNFYWNSRERSEEALGEYCVLGYFDALDITEADKRPAKEFKTWEKLCELTFNRKTLSSCRMIVCITDQQEKDEKFWNDKTQMLYFIVLVRVNKNVLVKDKWEEMKSSDLLNLENYIYYLSYDHSEIIVVTKTNTYSDGIKSVKLIREVCKAVKTYTVFAVRESALQSYSEICSKLTQETVGCRLHCMVKDYRKAEEFLEKLKKHFNDRNGQEIKICKAETFGGYDWLLEIEDVSIASVFECYKMGEMLTHSNKDYAAAFFNVESEILSQEEKDDGELDRSTEKEADRGIRKMPG